MPNIIPPLLSSTPPPVLAGLDDDEDDEFGDFTTANDFSYEIDGKSVTRVCNYHSVLNRSV